MSSEKKCCVPECLGNQDAHIVLHLFPNPEKDIDRFKSWLFNIGGDILAFSNEYIYKNRRVCHAHFETKYCCRYDRISNIAVPTLNLPGLSKQQLPTTATIKRPLTSIENIMNMPSTSKACPLLWSVQDISTSISTPPSGPEKAIKLNSPESKISSDVSKEDVTNQKRTRSIKLTNNENKLYKKLLHVKAKLSNFKNKYKKQTTALKTAKNLLTNIKFIKALENIPSTGKLLTLMQFRENTKKDKGRRFTEQEKLLSLAIMKQSPKAYRFLRKIFILPSPQTLGNLLSKSNFGAGINKNVFAQLKVRGEKMTDKERLCIILFDEISVKPSISFNQRKDVVAGFVVDMNDSHPVYADHAQVFMVRGLVKNYKQPVAYTFSSGATSGPELAKQINIVINEMQEAGFIVLATVCDQGTNNRSAINILINVTNREYLRRGEIAKNNLFEINGQQIIPLYDPPHLLKGIRNNLLTKTLRFEIDGECKVAKWCHLEMLMEKNPSYKGVRIVPKLTENHVEPKKISKMKVKYAAQVFSKAVAANMGYLADINVLPKECKDTADLLLFFDDLFDSVNGSFSNKKRFSKPLLQAVTPNSLHHEKWFEFKSILKTMKFCKDDSAKMENVPTLKNWIWTLEGIEILLKKLQKEYKITSFWMRHLNQDPVENFFGAIRSHGCRNVNPTPEAFQSAYATLLVNNLTSVHAPGGNCENDYCEALITFFSSKDCKAIGETNIDFNKILNITVVPLEEKCDPKVMAPLQYVSGYLVRKSKKLFKNCTQCNEDLISKNEIEYIKYREYSNKRWLCSPTQSVVRVISAFQDIITDEFKENLEIKNIAQYLKTLLYAIVDFNCFKCDIHKIKLQEYIINLAIRFFLYNHCKTINKILTGMQETIDETDQYQIMAKNYYKKHYKRPH